MDKVWDLIKSPVVNVLIRPSFWHSGRSALSDEKWGLCDVLIYCGPLTPSHAEMVELKEGLRAWDHMKRSNWRKETKVSGMVWHEENLSRHRCIFAEICGNTPKTSPNLTFNTYSELNFSSLSPSTPESLPERQRGGYEGFSCSNLKTETLWNVELTTTTTTTRRRRQKSL